MSETPANYNAHPDLRSLINDDAFAASFQSMARYRTALLEYVAPAVQGEPVATIHVDGSFVHVAWRIPAPSRCAMDVYTAPQPAEQQPQPESATHYRPSTGVYYQVIDGKTYAWRDAKVGWMPSPRKGIPDDCVCLMSSEQQPAPDVSGLVEALEYVRYWLDRRCSVRGVATTGPLVKIDAALAAHRKQGGET